MKYDLIWLLTATVRRVGATVGMMGLILWARLLVIGSIENNIQTILPAAVIALGVDLTTERLMTWAGKRKEESK